MKIAYLIIAHNSPKHLNRLINRLNDRNVYFFICIDKRSRIFFDLPKVNNLYVSRDVKIYWGGFSFVQAVISLLKKAKKLAKFDYYILLSGVDYPVRSNERIQSFFTKHNGKEFINISPMPDNNKTFDRVEYFYLETDLNFNLSSIIKRSINRLIRILNIKRSLPRQYSNFIFFGGSTWWMLSGKAINYIVNFIDNNPIFLKFYKSTLVPDESFFQTILGNSKFKKKLNNSLTFTTWEKKSPHPSIISEKQLSILQHDVVPTSYGNKLAHILFARKFSESNTYLLDILDKKILK